MKAITAFILAFSFFFTANAQPNPDTLWTRTYGGSNYDAAYSVEQTADGGYIVAGLTYSFGAGWTDFYLVKTDSQGDTLWKRTYGGSDYDWAESVQQTADGGYIVAGYTNSFGQIDVYMVKTDPQGDTLWTRTYGGSNYDDWAESVQQTADGGYIVAGSTRSFGAGGDDFYIVKTSSQGDTLWTRTYGGIINDQAESVQQTADGGYIVAGFTRSFGMGSADFYLVKMDSLGDTLWTRTYGGNSRDEAYSVQETTDGGYIVAGYTGFFGEGDADFYLVKTDNQGDTLWTRTFGGGNDDAAYSVQETTDGGYVVAGYTYSFGAGGSDFYLVKTGPDQWGREPLIAINPISIDFDSVEVDSQARAVVTFTNIGDANLFIEDVVVEGEGFAGPPWDSLTLVPGAQSAAEVTFTPIAEVEYSGWLIVISNAASSPDSVELSGVGFVLSAVDHDQFAILSTLELLGAYPNPFNASTQIAFALPKAGHATLTIFNLQGEKVATLIDGVLPAGLHTISFDGTGLASGMYLYRLQTEGFVQTRKMVLLK